jgi:hypothetical protein
MGSCKTRYCSCYGYCRSSECRDTQCLGAILGRPPYEELDRPESQGWTLPQMLRIHPQEHARQD